MKIGRNTTVLSVLAAILGMGIFAIAAERPPSAAPAKKETPKTAPWELPNSTINVPWDANTPNEPLPENDADYESFYKRVPKTEYPALRERFNPSVKPSPFEYEKTTHPLGDKNPRTYRFDMGPKDSPLEKGYTRVTRDDLFTWDKGWGWQEKPADDFLYTGPESVSVRKQADFDLLQLDELEASMEKQGRKLVHKGMRKIDNANPLYEAFLDDLSRDAILNPGELSFKVTLPDGHYMVTMILGDVQLPRYGMDVYANGQRVASDIYTLWTPWPQRVVFPVYVVRNNLRLSVRANDTQFLERSEVSAAPPDYAYGRLPGMRKGQYPIMFHGKMMNLHGPATQMAIAGVTIAPYQAPPTELVRQRLVASPDVKDRRALDGVEKFNSGDRTAAEKSFREIPDSDYLLKAYGLLAIAGHLETEEADELRCLDAAIEVLRKGVEANPDDIAAADLLRMARMHRGGVAFYAKRTMPSMKIEGLPQMPGYGQDSQGRSFHRRKESALFTWTRPGDILYSKALMRYARHVATGDPPRGLWPYQSAEDIFIKLDVQEPGNRFTKWYLEGDTTGWNVPDYSANTGDAPKWAVQIREAYNRVLDQAAWWGQNRRQPDGSLGGGWGDDVEVGADWLRFVILNPDANPEATETARGIAEGVWWSGEIDRDTGYYDGMADVEHTAEWTGDTQPYLIAIDYGNPLYYERNLKTGKLMRDLWMGTTPKGHLHFKAMVFSDKEMGKEYGGVVDAEIDCPLNGRATASAYWDWWYSPVDGLDNLFTQWANAWFEDSMRAENGKPAGIIPGPIGFHTDTLGGNQAKVWRQGAPGTNSYENPSYDHYVRALFARMYGLTGDEKWLKPKAVKLNSVGVVPDQFQTVTNVGEEYKLGDKYARLKNIDIDWILTQMRATWPAVTSESANTDRIGVPGQNQTLDLLLGGELGNGLDFIPMTLQKTSKNVAFMNLSSSQKGAKTIFYNFSDKPEPVCLRLWKLQVGAEHEVTIGIDKNDDDQSDETLQTLTYKHAHRGDPVEFNLPSRKAIVVEVKQTKPGAGAPKRVVDLALAAEDILCRDGKLFVTVHNIGNENCKPFDVKVWQGEAGKGQLLKTFLINGLEAPNDLEPRTVTNSFEWTPPKDATVEKPALITVQLDPGDKYYEITEQNNVKSRAFPSVEKPYHTPRLWKTLADKHGLKQWDPFPADFPKGEIR